MDIARLLSEHGGVVPLEALVRLGPSARRITAAASRGEILRVRRGWYATLDAPRELVRAVRVGGSLTSVSATRRYQLWTIDDGQTHVSVGRNASRLRSPSGAGPLSARRDRVCLHWRNEAGPDRTALQHVLTALIDVIDCQPEEHAIAVVDSALNLGLVTRYELEAAVRLLPRRFRRAVERADGRSQSGTETLVRLRLLRRGLKVRIQVQCGAARVDILVGDRLVIECLSRAFHTGVEQYARDRERELTLVDGRYLTMTLSYEQVLYDWERVQDVILRRVADGDHHWPRRRSARPFSGRTGTARPSAGPPLAPS